MSGPDDGASAAGATPRAAPRVWVRLGLLLLLVATIVWLGWQYGEVLSLSSLASREAALLDAGRRHSIGVVSALFVLYVAVTASSIPAATALTFLAAWMFVRLFGPVPGFCGAVLLVSFASTAGATIAFLISRHLVGRALRERYVDAVSKFDDALRRDGAYYLFTLRLTPVVPFWLVNLAMGLTPIRTATFWWVSQLGMLPGTFVFVFAGSQVPSLMELERRGVWEILWPGPFVALLLLAVFPWLVRWLSSSWSIQPEQVTQGGKAPAAPPRAVGSE